MTVEVAAAAAAAADVVPAWVSFCSNTAPLASIVVFFAPMPTIQQIQRDHTVGNLPLLPYSSMITSCFLWLTYGILKEEFKIWFTNGIGLLFGMYYFVTFKKFAPPRSPTLPGSQVQHIQGIMLLVGMTWIIALFPSIIGSDDSTEFIGNLSVLFCVALFGSPLAALKTVITTKSSISIPLPFTIATVANCFLWSVGGLFDMKDANVYVPNLLGLTFGLAQVTLKLIYTKDGGLGGGGLKILNRESSSELELML